MPKKLKIALIFGGRSAEHDVSITSAVSIFQNLNKQKYDVLSLFINRAGRWKPVATPLLSIHELNDGKFFSFLPWISQNTELSLQADIYFPILHGPFGEDGTIQGLFEMASVPYVGAAVLGSAVAMDKAVAKALFTSNDLPTVKYSTLMEKSWGKDQNIVMEKIQKNYAMPIYVKPANLGSSVGITKVTKISEIKAAVKTAFIYDNKILVEEGITGQEIECSVLGNDEVKASLPGEVKPYRDFYDYRDKYIEGKTIFNIPADLPSDVTKEIQRISIEAFKTLECSGMARVDFFIQEKTRKIYLNEINTIPGFTEISMYPKLWEVSGLPFPQLLDRLIELGLEKHNSRKKNSLLELP